MESNLKRSAMELEDRLAEVESRLLEMEDVEAVRRVLADYCRAVDSADLHTLESLFARDALFTVMPWKVEVRGRNQLLDFFPAVL